MTGIIKILKVYRLFSSAFFDTGRSADSEKLSEGSHILANDYADFVKMTLDMPYSKLTRRKHMVSFLRLWRSFRSKSKIQPRSFNVWRTRVALLR